MYFLYIPVAATPRLADGGKEVQRGDEQGRAVQSAFRRRLGTKPNL